MLHTLLGNEYTLIPPKSPPKPLHQGCRKMIKTVEIIVNVSKVKIVR